MNVAARSNPYRRSLIIAALTLVSAVVSYFVIGWQLVAPARDGSEMTAPQGFEAVTIASAQGTLSAWQAGSPDAAAVVVLLHPARADRRAMLDRARFLQAGGVAVVLPDLQAHGESAGRRVTYGLRESEDVLASVAHARRRFPRAAVVTLGVGMGGAASLLALPALDIDGMIIESVMPDLNHAVANRLRQRYGAAGVHLAPAMAAQLRWRLGAPDAAFRTYARAPLIEAPVLVIAASEDRRVPSELTLRFFERIEAPKGIWLVGRAVHQDLYWVAGEEYERRILEFVSRSGRN